MWAVRKIAGSAPHGDRPSDRSLPDPLYLCNAHRMLLDSRSLARQYPARRSPTTASHVAGSEARPEAVSVSGARGDLSVPTRDTSPQNFPVFFATYDFNRWLSNKTGTL